MKVDVMCCFHQCHDTHHRSPIACTTFFFWNCHLLLEKRQYTILLPHLILHPIFCLWSSTPSPVLYIFLNSQSEFLDLDRIDLF
jgi:hypothetical protein